MKEIYLDNNATTKPLPEVVNVVQHYFSDNYGNPSSLHRKGVEADEALSESRRTVSEYLGVKQDTVIFTSGGTESNNLVLRGAAAARSKEGNHIVTTEIEHASVRDTIQQLEEENFRITRLEPDENGVVTSEDVEQAITDDTVIVSIMHVNNETGAVFPVRDIAARIKSKAPSIFVHSDGVQALGKVPVNLDFIDAYTMSGHKIHAPKGVGAFYLAEDAYIKPLVTGGGHEFGWRSGTENIPGILGFGTAVRQAFEHRDKIDRLAELNREMEQALRDKFEHITVNSPEQRVPTTLNVSFPPVPGEIIVHALSEKGIYVSTGAACSSKKREGSHVLKGMGLAHKLVNSSIRFSFSRFTSREELEYTVDVLKHVIPRLKKIAGRTTIKAT